MRLLASIFALVLVAASARAQGAPSAQSPAQLWQGYLKVMRDHAVYCIRVALRDAGGNHQSQMRLVSKCYKAFIKAAAQIDDPKLKEIWPLLVFVEEEIEPLWQSALAEAMAKVPKGDGANAN
jgi:hypothetical protein